MPPTVLFDTATTLMKISRGGTEDASRERSFDYPQRVRNPSRTKFAGSPNLEKPMKVLLAVDGSAYSKRMLAYLAAHEELLGNHHQFTAITVLPSLPSVAEVYADPDQVRKSLLEEAEGILRPVRSFAEQKKWALDSLILEGDPARAIAQHAEGGEYDLLIMGCHGHSPLAGLILGSVSTKVLAQCRTPVLLIR